MLNTNIHLKESTGGHCLMDCGDCLDDKLVGFSTIAPLNAAISLVNNTPISSDL